MLNPYAVHRSPVAAGPRDSCLAQLDALLYTRGLGGADAALNRGDLNDWEQYMPFVYGERVKRSVKTGVLVLGLAALAACSSGGGARTFQSQSDDQGFRLFGRGKTATVNGDVPAIGVNGYLWRATLDTLSFMPLASADPYGGVVITDWYVNPEKPDERFKCTVYILDSRLRADGLNVAVFKQSKDAAGNWVDAPSAGQTETDLENAILTKARQLRLSNIG